MISNYLLCSIYIVKHKHLPDENNDPYYEYYENNESTFMWYRNICLAH